jgi:hypothetical protein
MIAHEIAMLYWLFALPFAVAITVIGDAGVGTDTGTGQHHQARVSLNEIEQGIGLRHLQIASAVGVLPLYCNRARLDFFLHRLNGLIGTDWKAY